MKSLFTRPALALALAAALAACGGTAQFTVGGTVSGLSYPGMVLSNGGATLPVAVNATAFSFPNTIDYGATYAVTVSTQPPHLDCKVYSGSGTAGQYANIAVSVICTAQTHTLGGTIAGLTADGLVLTNGSLGGTFTAAKDSTAFTFANKVDYASAYGVTVLTQPTGLTCTVSNGVGTMGDSDIATIAVKCAP